MVSAAAPCASPNAMSAAAVARQPIDEAGFMCVPPARDSRPRPASFFAPAYHALARRKGRRGRRPAGRQDGSPLTPSEPGLAPSPQPNSGVPEFGHDNWSKSETSEVDMGEGWGGGGLFDAAELIAPSRPAAKQRGLRRGLPFRRTPVRDSGPWSSRSSSTRSGRRQRRSSPPRQ